ncbi:hypothetical protein Mal65_43680 [Crateriforma conspicua]|nr:hypothetical protein Mal65_43680 [Crateriforma conspicua]
MHRLLLQAITSERSTPPLPPVPACWDPQRNPDAGPRTRGPSLQRRLLQRRLLQTQSAQVAVAIACGWSSLLSDP